MSRFVHLHTHSHYSLLSALPKIPELIAAAKKDDMPALALTDSGNMYGTIEFYKECMKHGIKPIIGVDFYVAQRTRNDKEPGIDNRRHRLILLAKNEHGYRNLIKLVTTSHLEGFYYKPRIDRELMQQHGADVVCIIPSFSGEIVPLLRAGDDARAQAVVDAYVGFFGKENVFIEITHHPEIEEHETLMQRLIAFGRAHNIPLVAAHDVYYINQDDAPARDTLLSIQSVGRERDDDNADFSFIGNGRASELFAETPDALENTAKIADMCTVTLDLGKWVFPAFAIPEGTTYESELRRLAYEGVGRRGLTDTPELRERVDYELGIIEKKGYAPYFLVVGDLLRHAHETGIFTNTRGSAAGSMVSYLVGITTINPIEYQIPFERFLNPERPSPPDIDMDMADNRRDEMIEYVRQKYGADKVAQIGTFGTMMARGAVRDTARALGFDYGTGDRIAKLIPMGSQGFPMSITRAMELEPELATLYKKDADAKRIMDMAKKIEGCARHISVHAAGVVISPTPLNDVVPVQLDPKGEGKIITQYDMHAVEDAGLLKFDFLGLKNLAILADVIRRVRKLYGAEINIDTIPLDDRRTYEMLARGETMGTFQLAGSGMTRYLKDLRPTSIYDINAMVALYRPGPIESIPVYIERKHNPKLVSYLDPRMEAILSRSYGVLTYQDDVLLVAIKIAGYTWLEADKFRKAMGKKIPAEMAAQKEKFISGSIDNGLTPAKADKLWSLIEPFAAYGFNKAHAASYGRVAYQTAYMKANFPAAYMAAVLTADAGNVDEVAEIVSECKRMGIAVLPPDINESLGDFTVVKKDEHGTAPSLTGEDKIRFGLHSIKNFGVGIADAIIEERKTNGHFTSLANFLERIQDRNLNKKSLEALIMCGALDAFGERGVMLHNIEDLLSYSKTHGSTARSQTSLFAAHENETGTLTLEHAEPATQDAKLGWEKELLGLYISGHPLDKHKAKLEKLGSTIMQTMATLKPGMLAVMYGIIDDVRDVVTKNGDRMAFLKVSDFSGTVEVVVFPKVWKEHQELLVAGQCIGIKGRVTNRNGETSIAAEALKKI